MTVLSLQWLMARPQRPAAVTRPQRPAAVTRPQRPAAVTRPRHHAIVTRWWRPAIAARHLGPASRPVPPPRRTYPDSFFADPVAVEDDSRRMRPLPRGCRFHVA